MVSEGFSESQRLVLWDIPTQTPKEMFLLLLCLMAILLLRSMSIH